MSGNMMVAREALSARECKRIRILHAENSCLVTCQRQDQNVRHGLVPTTNDLHIDPGLLISLWRLWLLTGLGWRWLLELYSEPLLYFPNCSEMLIQPSTVGTSQHFA